MSILYTVCAIQSHGAKSPLFRTQRCTFNASGEETPKDICSMFLARKLEFMGCYPGADHSMIGSADSIEYTNEAEARTDTVVVVRENACNSIRAVGRIICTYRHILAYDGYFTTTG